MIEKVKEKIDLNKKDKKTYKEYIESFTSCEKAKELFVENNDFKKLLGDKKEETNKEEDEFF